MKNLLKKNISGLLSMSLLLSSFVAVQATGDGTASTYPGVDSYLTAKRFISGSGNDYNPEYLNTNAAGYGDYMTKTPSENLFTVDGKEFILLDTDSDGNYFVMTNAIGANTHTTPSGLTETDVTNYEARRFNASNTDNVAYVINNNIDTYIPAAMQEKLVEKTWYSEYDDADKSNLAAHSTTCKLALPSYTELQKYKNKIGWSGIGTAQYGMQTRTTIKRADNSYYPAALAQYSSYILYMSQSVSNWYQVRPVCFIDKDFFRDVKVDTSATLGDNVKAEILKYEHEELTAGYTLPELAAIGYDIEVVDNSVLVPESYRSAAVINALGQATGMKDKDNNVIDSAHAKYENLGNDYAFTVGGKSFVVLGDDEAGDKFVVFKSCLYETGSNPQLWTAKTSTAAADYVYSVDNTNSAAVTLNSDAWINANIPAAMIPQLKEKTWWTEHDCVAYEDIDAWRTTAKIALPSYTEVKTYSDRFPFGNVQGNAREWLRSFQLVNGTLKAVGLIDESSKIRSSAIGHSSSRLRPVFYVDKDFFKNVKLDVSTIGDGLKAEIVSDYTAEELISTYTKSELIALGYDEAEVNKILVSNYPKPAAYASACAKGAYSGLATDANNGDTLTENLFTVDGKNLIYLDTDDDGNMFVMVEDKITNEGYKAFVPDETEGYTEAEVFFDVNNANSVASQINTAEFKASNLPVSLDGYLVKKDWYLEKDGDAFSTNCEIALPSITELVQYASVVGKWNKQWLNTNMITRTPSYSNESLTGVYTVWYGGNPELVRVNVGQGSYATSIRPVFFISKDYFTENHLDVSLMGDTVKTYFIQVFEKTELAAGTASYTEEELVSMGFTGSPSAKDVTITADAYAVGQTLTAGYTFVADGSGAAEDTSKTVYQWYVSDNASTGFVEIAGATAATYTIPEAYVGKYIKVGVKTANADAEAVAFVLSDATCAIGAKLDFLFKNVVLYGAGNNIVQDINGETALTAKLTIKNESSSDTPKTVIIAVYDADNRLQKVNVETPTIVVGEQEYPISIDGFTAGANWKARVMVWDDLDSLSPIYGTTY